MNYIDNFNKFVQINENISRYDFGTYHDNIPEIWNNFFVESIPLKDNEKEILFGILDDFGVDDFGRSLIFCVNMENLQLTCMYNILYLGDYCYAIFVEKISERESSMYRVEIIDGFDDLCQSLEKIKQTVE